MADDFLGVGGREDEYGTAQPLPIKRHGGLKTHLVGYDEIYETYKSTENSKTMLVEKYNSAVISLTGEGALLVNGYYGNESGAKRLPFMNHKFYMMDNGRISGEGVYHIDLRGIKNLKITSGSPDDTFDVGISLSLAYAPKPSDTQVNYKRITPEDMGVIGYFRAIIPLTDLTMGRRTLTAVSNKGESYEERRIFKDEDPILAGMTLFGPFNEVQITSGVALLVEM